MNAVDQAEMFLKKAQRYGSVLGLKNMENLMYELDNIHDQMKIIHVAGTNGKGSCCVMLSSILKAAGYKVGTYTSPAVFNREEQYLVNQKPVDRERLALVFCRLQQACDRLTESGGKHPTIFEVETAAAFLLFYQEKCDLVVLETGLGGAGDATNIISHPVCSVFTAISMDHMGFLGGSLEQIAMKKAGIIKEGCPVVSAGQKEEVMGVLSEAAGKKNAALVLADRKKVQNIRSERDLLWYDYKTRQGIALSLTGSYQIENSLCVLESVDILRKQGFAIEEAAVRAGLKNALWPGRFERISRQPLFIIDGAHNEDAAVKLYESLKFNFTNREKIYIIGVLEDKEYHKILKQLLPLAKKVYTVTPNHVRALSGRELCKAALDYHTEVRYCEKIEEAVRRAEEDARMLKEKGMIVAFGSLSYLREIKNAVRKEELK